MYRLAVILVLSLWQALAAADLTIEITEGVQGAIPLAIVPFRWQGANASLPEDVSAIVAADLTRSGRFRTLPERDMLSRPSSGAEVDFRDWRTLGQDALVVGQVLPSGSGGYLVQFQLLDVLRGEQVAAYSVPTTSQGLRLTAHQIADIVYEKLTGTPGVFATRIAYITEDRSPGGVRRVSLKVSDADGYNPQTIVSSPEPLMSPAWAPDGHRLAYVSFERKRQAIFIQEVRTGNREQVVAYPGINSAPAWSPDGRRLALVLSRDGNPEIYVLDLASRALTRITRNFAIDTEPAWSPDGRTLVFTSDRGGSPQIYRVAAGGGEPRRLTFEGNYNARASYAPDGRSLVLVTRRGGVFRIGLLNLANGALQELTHGPLDESPSFAPNGSMIIYGAKVRGRGELSAVSSDGRVRQRILVAAGDVREPAWSPPSK
jgi:TolB protein